jgi:hypothetical protein
MQRTHFLFRTGLRERDIQCSTSGIAASIPFTWSLLRNEGAILKGGPSSALADSGTAGERTFESRELFGRQRFQSVGLFWIHS